MFSVLNIVIFSLKIVQIVQCIRQTIPCGRDREDGICIPLEQCPGLYNKVQYKLKHDDIKRNETIDKYACRGKDKNKNNTICCLEKFLNFEHLLVNTTVCGIPTNLSLNYPGYTKRLEYSFMAILIYSTENQTKQIFGCGGSIISAKYILTAAHCLYINSTLNLEYVRVGAHNLNASQNCNKSKCSKPWRDIQIKYKIPHPDYIQNKTLNDIALIKLISPVNFANRYVKPICLPITEHLQKISVSNFIDVGWGSTRNRQYSSAYLKASTLQIKSNNICKTRYPEEELGDKQLCAAGNTCYVDSGGPAFDLMIIKNHVRYVQFGISTSTVLNCNSDEEIPMIYTRVSKYISWILPIILQ